MAAGKRKAAAEDGNADDSDASDYAPSAIDVSFDFVAPTEIDFAALKRLSQQLFHTHASEVDLSALVDDILSWGNKSVGTVVKVEDDEDADPFAFASVVNLSNDTSSPASEAGKALRQYYNKIFTSNAASSSKSAQSINSLLTSVSCRPLQIYHERMINLPPQIMPPLYRMLLEEIRNNTELNAATHLVFFSRVFSTAAFDDDEDEEDNGQLVHREGANGGKKQKRAIPNNKAIGKMKSKDETGEEEIGLFHPEDALLAKHALHTYTYRFPGVKDSDESFNAPMFGRIVIVKRTPAFARDFVQELETAFALPV